MTIILTEVEVGQGQEKFWATLGEMIEVAVGQDQVLEQVQAGIE